jgi:hypothetical protein
MAYFSSEGAPIHSGAAGVGQDSGPLMAFRDGSLGRRGVGQDSGPLMAFNDGSLGQDSGPLMAFNDGSLGQDSGPLMSFRDGSLGHPIFMHSSQGKQRLPSPVTLTHGVRGCRGCGVGAVTNGNAGPTLNMSDPTTILEAKNLMGVVAQINAPQLTAAVPAGFFENPVWDEASKNFAGQWIVAVGSQMPGVDVASFFDAPDLLPNASGVTGMLTILGYPNLVSAPIEPTPPPTHELFPISTAFFDQAVLGKAPPGNGRLAMIGLGVVALIGVAFFMLPKKKKR